MKYILDTTTNKGFLLCVTLPESGDAFAAPRAVQLRGGENLLLRLKKLLAEAIHRRDWAEEHFHEEHAARRAFEDGEVLHAPGSPLLVVTLQRRQANVIAGSTVLFHDVVSLDLLQEAISAELQRIA